MTIYATLGDEAVAHAINETEVEFILTDAALLTKLATIADKLTNVKYIVYIGEIKKSSMLDFPKGTKMISMENVEDLGTRPENGRFSACQAFAYDGWHEWPRGESTGFSPL